jgi:hypothetical protein
MLPVIVVAGTTTNTAANIANDVPEGFICSYPN